MDDLSEAYDAYDRYAFEDMPSEASSYDNLCAMHRRILCDLNKKISHINDDRGSVASKQSRRSSKSRKSFETTSSAVERRTEMMAKAARLSMELKFHEIEREKSAVLRNRSSGSSGKLLKLWFEYKKCIEARRGHKCSKQIEQYVESQHVCNLHKGLFSVHDSINPSVVVSNGKSRRHSDSKLDSHQEVHPQSVTNEGSFKSLQGEVYQQRLRSPHVKIPLRS